MNNKSLVVAIIFLLAVGFTVIVKYGKQANLDVIEGTLQEVRVVPQGEKAEPVEMTPQKIVDLARKIEQDDTDEEYAVLDRIFSAIELFDLEQLEQVVVDTDLKGRNPLDFTDWRGIVWGKAVLCFSAILVDKYKNETLDISGAREKMGGVFASHFLIPAMVIKEIRESIQKILIETGEKKGKEREELHVQVENLHFLIDVCHELQKEIFVLEAEKTEI